MTRERANKIFPRQGMQLTEKTMIYRLLLGLLTVVSIGWIVFGTSSYYHDKRVLKFARVCLKNEIGRMDNERHLEGKVADQDQRLYFGAGEVMRFEQTCNVRVITPNINNAGLYSLHPETAQNDFEPVSLWMSKEPNLLDMILLGIVTGVSALVLVLARNIVSFSRKRTRNT